MKKLLDQLLNPALDVLRNIYVEMGSSHTTLTLSYAYQLGYSLQISGAGVPAGGSEVSQVPISPSKHHHLSKG